MQYRNQERNCLRSMILRSRIRMYPLDDFSPTELTGVLIYRFMGRLRFPTAALDFELTMK